MQLNRVFQRICAKVITSNEILMFKEDVATTICMLEMVMLPSFFDVMIHLVIHLVKSLICVASFTLNGCITLNR